jgi:uncharacterized protein
LSNRLAQSRSPYLLQHANNPVDWYPWGDEAFERARGEDKPVLVSIGYSACHWCHVMAHESFENESVARLMNDNFVNVKVDREERPDVDAVYMDAVQMMTGQGGWPMNVFLTPDREPFFGGTYWPPAPRHGMPSWPQLLQSIALAWRNERPRVCDSAASIVERLAAGNQVEQSSADLNDSLLNQAFETIHSHFDRVNGGFGGAPKFPQAMTLGFLLRYHARTGRSEALEMVQLSLDRMAAGGIYDHLGGGFHRYSVDAQWVVPHFEKMLYDNALLSRIYTEAWQVTGDEKYRETAVGVLDYVLRDMTAPEGGFYSAEDADSEGEEGKFYVWTKTEIEDLLEPVEADWFSRRYDVAPDGNFEGTIILTAKASVEDIAAQTGTSVERVQSVLKSARHKLMEARAKRIRPARDDKILTDWNALMLQSFALAGRAFDRPDYLEAARRNGAFLLEHLYLDGRLGHVYKQGRSETHGYLDDYTNLLEAMTALFESTGEVRWLNAARELSTALLELFADDRGGFFTTSVEAGRELPVRPKSLIDGVTPSGNSSAVMGLLRLAALTDDRALEEPALDALRLVAGALGRHGTSFGYALSAMDFHLSTPKEVVIVGPAESSEYQQLARTRDRAYLPNVITVRSRPEDAAEADLPLLQGKTMIDGRPTAYVCERYTCRTPVTDPSALAAQLAPPPTIHH